MLACPRWLNTRELRKILLSNLQEVSLEAPVQIVTLNATVKLITGYADKLFNHMAKRRTLGLKRLSLNLNIVAAHIIIDRVVFVIIGLARPKSVWKGGPNNVGVVLYESQE